MFSKETDKTFIQHTKNKHTMKAKNITNEYFLRNIFNYASGTQEWNYQGERPAIIDFYATWCGPCKALAPTLDRLAEEYDGKVDILKVDVDQERELASAFGIRSVPSLLFIPKEGQPQMAPGALPYGQLKEAIEKILLP